VTVYLRRRTNTWESSVEKRKEGEKYHGIALFLSLYSIGGKGKKKGKELAELKKPPKPLPSLKRGRENSRVLSSFSTLMRRRKKEGGKRRKKSSESLRGGGKKEKKRNGRLNAPFPPVFGKKKRERRGGPSCLHKMEKERRNFLPSTIFSRELEKEEGGKKGKRKLNGGIEWRRKANKFPFAPTW